MATKEYLLAVVSAVLSGKEIPDLPQDVDVTQFVRLAFTNAVQGIVFSAFAENPGALPEALFARLKKSFQAGVLRDAAQTQMLSILQIMGLILLHMAVGKSSRLFLDGLPRRNRYWKIKVL